MFVRFGKHAGLTYAEIAAHEPKYCNWVKRAAKTKLGSAPAISDLAEYLESSESVQEELAHLQPVLIQADQLTREQHSVVDNVFAGENLLLTGAAGTGKSFLLRYLIQELRLRHPEQVAITASTGIAAANIGGQTVHSFAGIGLGWGSVQRLVQQIQDNPQASKRWQQTQILVVDEVSMLDGQLFTKLEEIARRVRCSQLPFGGLQLLLSGDFLQLPPVQKADQDKRLFCFQSTVWKKCGLHKGVIALREPVRQGADPTFVQILNELRLGRVSPQAHEVFKACHKDVKAPPPDDGIVPTKLYCVNRDVDKENAVQLDELPGEAVVIKAEDAWIAEPCKSNRKNLQDTMSKRVPKKMSLKVGAQVILLKNKPDWGLVNGSRGIVVAFRSNYPMVRFETGVTRRLQEEIFELNTSNGEGLRRSQIPLKLGWALTVHKAAGLTLTRAELRVDRAFEAGQTYVALSRLTGTDGLWISGKGINQSSTRADPEALQFYADYSCRNPLL